MTHDTPPPPDAPPPPPPILMEGVHPACLDDDQLRKECEESFGRQRGPGGQHRNRRDSAVHLRHVPSGVEILAAERRSQQDNRRVAWRRLRLKLARRVRRRIDTNRYACSDLWKRRRQGSRMGVSPRHADYPPLLAEAMDVIEARAWDVAGAAGTLGITMSQLVRLVRHDAGAFDRVNRGRLARGWHRLRK
ncbi:MAG: peptide chain release factor-like protein [Phycisphaerales bacterium]|nr:peptide chain release factor-like protein [Phycisphaerales bacterium]